MTALVHFDRRGRWGETLVCDDRVRQQLQRLGVALGRGAPAAERSAPHEPARHLPPARLPAQGEHLHHVVEGTAVFYLGLDTGWLGLLCEAGEWVMVPASLPLGIDRGAQAPGGVVHVGSGATGTPAGLLLPAALPAHDDFVAHLLELLGEEQA
ncbi:MAG TPA: hypothetical protein VFE82_05245 [Ramlibacter sp.]|jgi:1,2-dihydroxy-3-keto-5-methylthiopentene dioxygenase|uniref:hypothetical protein n=1 Tax=Ramlibacter sp. TaxID=1917967 RepID=UPI002D571B47|nr:hypothetical protein [Ramlibacter sp.]HZY17865.1 hypothetical protein [Ramlibacter sp.]